MGMDRSMHFQFKGHNFFFSEESTPKRDVLILEGDKRILRIVMSIIIFEGNNRAVLHKPAFMFGDATLDSK